MHEEKEKEDIGRAGGDDDIKVKITAQNWFWFLQNRTIAQKQLKKKKIWRLGSKA